MTFERDIAAPVERVWATMTDVGRYPERFATIGSVALADGVSFGVGTRWRETRTIYGRSVSVDYHVCECLHQGHYVTESQVVGARALMEYVFTPSPDGTRTAVRVTFRTEGGGIRYKVLAALGGRRITACAIEQNNLDLADLARSCEAALAE